MKLKLMRLSYKQQLVRVGQGLCLSTLMFLLIPTTLVKAQITPDESLSTSVKQQGDNKLNINGGVREGNNLFHSFEEFSISEGLETVFENASDIENIFTRVTGSTISDINGILRTQGGASFFLINPNGIVFSENAQLDVGGSFVATTASSIQFEDAVEFTASDLQEQPILTVSVPIGLQFDGSSNTIEVKGNFNSSQFTVASSTSPTTIEDTAKKISIDSERTLALIGGNVVLDSAVLTTKDGEIVLGGVNTGLVNLEMTEGRIDFNYETVENYQNIELNNASVLDVSGESGGAIFLTGENITFKDGSIALIQNQEIESSGSINVDATETFSGILNNSINALRSEALGTAQGSDINVSAKSIIAQRGGGFGTATYQSGKAGDINVNALNMINLMPSGIGSITFDSGNAGDVSISTDQLRISNGGQVSSTSLGTGAGGELNINADLIELLGVFEQGNAPTLLGTTAFRSGDAKNVNINSSKLKVVDGAFLSSNSFADGNPGNVIINSSESVEIIGSTGNLSSTIGSSVVVLSENIRNRNELPNNPSGSSGSLTLNSPSITVENGGEISVKNEGIENAGVVLINTNTIDLSTDGKIIANSASGSGGNININAEQIQLDTQSNISATAQNNGDGGNVTIKTNTIIAKKTAK